ncbi:zinc finger protein 281b isoform X1 [Silurus meridionalis]|uniref:zinc finger protein 281b isoform X1 n=1 Tax=Silurus meridionalis TaxID=175797 RepID=UPI001EEBDDFB|nr:zinc finger protein 281b isoform X1 [Silurus meridionalis]
MSIIQDKLGNEFLRNGSMDPNFAPSMIMFSHLPPVTSFTRLTSQPVVTDLPQEMVLKKERDSPEHGGGFLHSMGIKQEKFNELDYRIPLYGSGPGTGGGKSSDMLDISLGSHQNMLLHDVNISSQLPQRLGKDPKDSTHRKGRRANGEGTEGRGRRKRGDSTKSVMLDGEGGPLSPSSKPHICEHCNAAFRSSYHLRRHVLIHTGERPFRCSQCNMSFIQKYLLQRHEKIHSGEKPFSCDQCNMRFIQKYHMERHKRTHSGEKPYKCDTCQQYFSRTDRLLKHKRTCGEAIKKGLDPGMLDLGEEDLGQGSYLHTQGNASAPPRKRGKSKNSGEGGERRRKKTAASGANQMVGLQDYAIDMAAGSGASSSGMGNMADTSMANQHVRTPKLGFKRGGRKGADKSLLSVGEASSSSALHEQKLLPPKSNPMDLPGPGDMDGLGLLQSSSESKQGGTSSNYDDAMQFLKKRRYLHLTNSSGGGDYGSVHLPHQQTVIQGGIGEPTLALLDTSPLVSVDHKHDKSGIPDEVLQSLLDHYSHKSDVTFDLSDPHHIELHAASATPELGADESSSNGSADKSGVMNEYSKFLLQTLERTSHGGSGVFTFFPEKHMYAMSPLECTFGQSVSSPHGPSSVPKSHFSMLVGSQSPSHTSPSSQQAFHLSALEPSAHQQLTPSQELTEQLDTQALANGGGRKEQVKNVNVTTANSTSTGSSSVYSLSSPPDLTALQPSKEVDMRPTFQIENFAQAFGSQFKSERRTPLAYSSDPQIVVVEVDPRISRTPVSEFSGYTSLLAEVNEPASSGTKTPTSQSYR